MYICSLVALVVKGSALLVFPVIQPHTYSVLIDARMCGSVNEVNTPIPCVGEPQQCLQFTQTLSYKLVNTWFLQLYIPDIPLSCSLYLPRDLPLGGRVNSFEYILYIPLQNPGINLYLFERWTLGWYYWPGGDLFWQFQELRDFNSTKFSHFK